MNDTFASAKCPICAQDIPHVHNGAEVHLLSEHRKTAAQIAEVRALAESAGCAYRLNGAWGDRPTVVGILAGRIRTAGTKKAQSGGAEITPSRIVTTTNRPNGRTTS